MDYLLLYNRKKEEQGMIKQQIRDNVAYLSESMLDITEFSATESVRAYLKKDGPVDMAILEIMNAEDIDLTKDFREEKENALMMLVAPSSISPVEYLNPQIRACSLLLKPYTSEVLAQTAKQFVAEYFRQKEGSKDGSEILIENRQGKIRLSAEQIYYVEVRGKKVYFRMKDREYSKYDSLESIKGSLPDTFMQCHRSYLFNTRYLERVKLSEKMIYLSNEITVPLSRSFKAEIKEYVNELPR